MERFVSLIRNKYLLAGVVFVVWMSFFDRYDFATQYAYQKEKNKLESEKEFYTSEIESITTSIHNVQKDPNVIEQIAREKYKMKKDNEDIYIIVDADMD